MVSIKNRNKAIFFFEMIICHSFISSYIQMRSTTLEEFSKQASHLRLLMASQAYNMGTDTPNIRQVIHAGAKISMDSKNMPCF